MHARVLSVFLILTVVVAGFSTAALAAPNTVRMSVSSNGTQSNGGSGFSAVSQDGRYVAFDSSATNLIGLDTNGTTDVFGRDRKTGKTRRVSIRSNGAESNGPSESPDMSASGRYVTFMSSASNLVAGDTSGTVDIFVHDRKSKKTIRASTSSGGGQGNGPSFYPAISADGRYVIFESTASNLVGGDSNGTTDVFVKDRKTSKIRRVSLRSNGSQANGSSFHADISSDGRYVTFSSVATNLVNSDTNAVADVFLHDRQNKETRRVSVGGAGQGNAGSVLPSVNNKAQVAFASQATNLVGGDTNGAYDIFVRNTAAGTTRRVSVSSAGAEANGPSPTNSRPRISNSGRYVVFESNASNLVATDTNATGDIFVRDRKKNRTRRVSLRFDGTESNGVSAIPQVTDDGLFVVFTSQATNLVGGDTNGTLDIFLRKTS